MQWWLLEREIRRWTVQVRAALDGLVADGLVLERQVDSGRMVYRINDQSLQDVRAFLGQARSKGTDHKGSGPVESVAPDSHARRSWRQEANDEMSTRITNKSRQALVVPLNSGTAINLAPGETCDPLDEFETTANAKIEKMSSSGLIGLTHVGDDDSAGGESHTPRKRART